MALRFQRILFIVFLWLIGWWGAYAQASLDTSFVANARENLDQGYTQMASSESILYNGTEYAPEKKAYLKGHSYYKTAHELEGKIYYHNTWFPNVPLQYDLVLDQIIVEHPTSEFKIKLVAEKVKFFIVAGHTFIRLTPDSLKTTTLKAGFYDLLYDNKLQVLAHRSKRLVQQTTDIGLEGKYVETDSYFIYKKNIYYPVDKKKSVVKILADRKKEVQAFIRSNKLTFRQNRETDIMKLVQYYVQLSG
ncbi:hypothetical protein AHMF7605_17490 [Adhaeribacter arboris]|uniref:Uncharacterized protein n=1 Tax=Adhaeribacter arboris TaxID=2072846 RepID=A0A2T2YI41_9BACT|nr:hypothetical protein [Adhaeribacter arboris]PSR55172.1 hypothetical protein AHMF7605_17490 [Adhaeribacter arboris]